MCFEFVESMYNPRVYIYWESVYNHENRYFWDMQSHGDDTNQILDTETTIYRGVVNPSLARF